MTLFKHFRAILLLPFNVLIIIPTLLHTYVTNDYIISKLSPDLHILRLILSALMMIIGLFLVIANIVTFHKTGKGTLAPWDPPKKLVVVGMYQYVRNPMLTGIMTILLAETLLLFTTAQAYWMIFFITGALITIPFYEEKQLIARFGNEYLDYMKHVPRWIPQLKPYKSVK